MSPLKNTDRTFSDCLPPALVKDWRQCLRSRGYLAIFVLLLLTGWVLLGTAAWDVDVPPSKYLESLRTLGSMLSLVFFITLCLAIPFRAGMIVAADTRERSSNFLMLTPLTARRIVWGTWCSSALMVLLAALLLLPLCIVGEGLRGGYPHCGSFNLEKLDWVALGYDVVTLACYVFGGWVMAAFFMFCAGLPIALRFVLLVCMLGASVGTVGDDVHFIFCKEESRNLHALLRLLPYLFYALLQLVLFLELARRHYSAPAENCSRSVRLLAPLPMLLYVADAGISYVVTGHVSDSEEMRFFAFIFLYTAVMADALLPSYSLPQMRHRNWCWLPGWFQRPGFVPSVLCCGGATLLTLLPVLLQWWETVARSPAELEVTSRNMAKVCISAGMAFNVGFTLLLWLLITDCFCRRNSPKRMLAFGVVALFCSCFCGMLSGLTRDDAAEACMPMLGSTLDSWCVNELPEEILWNVCAFNAGAFLVVFFLLLAWRGLVRK